MSKLIIKISLIIALLLCLFEMPYWYYQLLRIFGTIGYVYLSYQDYNAKIKFTPQIFIASAIILNPIIKISFDRNTWQVVDTTLAIILLISILYDYRIKGIKYF